MLELKIYTTLRAVKTLLANYCDDSDCEALFNYINNRGDYDDLFGLMVFYRAYAEILPMPYTLTGPWTGITYNEMSKLVAEHKFTRHVQTYAYMNTHGLFLKESHSSQKEGRPGIPFYIMDLNPIISSYMQYSDSELRVSCTPILYKIICGTAVARDKQPTVDQYIDTLITIMLAGSRVNSNELSMPFGFKLGDITDKVTADFLAGNYDNIPTHNLTALYGWSKISGNKAPCKSIESIFG